MAVSCRDWLVLPPGAKDSSPNNDQFIKSLLVLQVRGYGNPEQHVALTYPQSNAFCKNMKAV
jgi:hypothetical protein